MYFFHVFHVFFCPRGRGGRGGGAPSDSVYHDCSRQPCQVTPRISLPCLFQGGNSLTRLIFSRSVLAAGSLVLSAFSRPSSSTTIIGRHPIHLWPTGVVFLFLYLRLSRPGRNAPQDHLHLHALETPFLSRWQGLRFSEGKPWCASFAVIQANFCEAGQQEEKQLGTDPEPISATDVEQGNEH